MNLTNLASNLGNLWNQGTQAVGNFVQNDIVRPVQNLGNQAAQQVQRINIPQQAINFDNMAQSFGQHLANYQIPSAGIPLIGGTISNIQRLAGQPQTFTPGQVGQGLLSMAQQIPRSYVEAKQTPLIQNILPGAPLPSAPINPNTLPMGRFLFGNQPLQSMTDTSRPAGQFLQGLGLPQQAVQAGTPALAAMGAIASDTPFGIGSAEKAISTEAISLAKGASSELDFARTLGSAKPEVKQFIANIIKDPNNAVNSVSDFWHLTQQATPAVTKQLAIQRLTNLIRYPADLEARGYSPAQIRSIGAGEYRNIVSNNIAPFEHPTFQAGKTIGELQQATQPADLTAYEKAFNSGNTNVLNQLAAAHPGDARFQVHQSIPDFNPDMGVQAKNANIRTPASPEFPNGGISVANPKDVAQQARLASFGARQSFEVRGGNLAQEMDSVLKNPKDNLNIRLALENPSMIDKYASRAKDPEAFAALAHKISDFYDYALGASKGQKMPLGEVNNYFTHVWDLSTPEAQQTFNDLMAANANNFRSGFTKERIINTIQEGLAKGLDLKNAKASDDILAYTRSMGKQISASAFNNKINELRPGGAVAFKDNGTVPYNYKGQLFNQSNHPGNLGTFIDPEIQKYMGYYNRSGLADNPVIHTLDKVNTGIKEMKLAGGLFHAMRESVNYTGQQLMSGHLPNLGGGVLSFINPRFARSQMDSFISRGTLDAASKMGIDIGSAGGIGDENIGTLDLLKSKDAIKQATFQRLIPYYILKTVDGLPESSRTPQVGKQIMALYNGLTNEVAGTNKTIAQAARFAFLAPQFNLGKIINVTSAFKPEMTPQATFARQALIGTALATMLEYQIAHYITSQKIDMDPKSIIANGILHPNIGLPYKSPTGKGLAADLPSSNLADFYKSGVGSLANAGIDSVMNNGKAGSDISQAETDAGHTVTSRTSSLVSLLNQLQSGKDYYGNPVNISNLAQSQLPIPVVQLLKTLQNNPSTGKPSQDFRTALLNTSGLRVHNDPNDPQVAQQTAYFNGIAQAAAGLNSNDQKIFTGMIHPTTKDADGNSIVDKNVYSSPDKFETLLAHPNVLEAEVKFQQSQPNHDPLWDLSPTQLQAYMQAQVISKNNPTSYLGSNDKTTSMLYAMIPQDFFTQRQQYFNNLVAQGVNLSSSGSNQAPQMPADIQSWFNQHNALPSAKAKALDWLSQQGQEAQNFLTQAALQTNQQRMSMGLPPLALNQATLGHAYSYHAKKVSIARAGAIKMPSFTAASKAHFKVVSGTSKAPHMAALPKIAGMKKTPAFKMSKERVYLSSAGSNQRFVRKQAGIEIPHKARKIQPLFA